MYEDILLKVNKPGQYIGGEINSSKKDFASSDIKFAIAFADLYEVGMSNLGLRIIYGVLNNIPDVVCERFFSPAQDMEELLRLDNRQILSLESRKKLSEFDLAGFSLGSELDYTNVLNILQLGGIPLRSGLRDHTYPLVIGGGPCTLNPEPLHDFFDFFCIGEAEELILEVTDLYRKHKEEYKSGKLDKQELLFKFSQIEGIYVPSFYDVSYASRGVLAEFKPKLKSIPPRIKKRCVKDLNLAYYPLDWIMPHVQIIHDRITLEIMRGCPNRCRFCQARPQYFPFRIKESPTVLNLADELYRRTGYEEISLAGLSVSDHPKIEEILKKLMNLFEAKAVSLSLPSLKAKALIGGVSSLIAKVKKTGLTFAPEAGSERLRNILQKDFNSAEFFTALEEAYAAGYQHIKLYFMIGLPQEKDEDLDAIIDFSVKVSELRKKAGKGAAGVNISINTLIPKPHTPFQWLKMQDLEAIKNKQEYLRQKAKRHKRLVLSFHNSSMSIIEGVFSRGDRRLSEVILKAFESGAKFDAWSNHFDFARWQAAFRNCGLDMQFYLDKKELNSPLPWDFIDTGIDSKTLVAEFNKTIAIE
ncbi:MAG: TIGR03960 family B12-binding radical SAM protein [Candidatus Omnitrophica bacterium]|nr:TIGR03960 family B12-binding radical SAM protein [Candidatus Omnitrophota bacterium]